jgi:HEAT repeat protein
MNGGNVAELLQQLADEKRRVREAAARALGERGDRRAVPHLIQALNDKSAKVRGAAAWALGCIGDEQAVPHLIQVLDDKRWEMRAQAVEALGRIGDKSALPHLIRALNDRKSAVRMQAASVLGQLGDKRVVPHLVQALDSNKGRVLLKIGWALGRLEALSALVGALDDRRWQVREAAVVGLGEIGKKAVPHLRRALDDPLQEVREQAALALGRLGYEVSFRRRTVRLSPAVLGRIKRDFPPEDREEVIELLKRYLERDAEMGRKLVYKIVKMSEGSKKEVAYLTEAAYRDWRDILVWYDRWQRHIAEEAGGLKR